MAKNVTLKNIAESVGLSVNSVSRALRDCDDISETTKELVRQKALELGYVPNSVASSLRNGKTNLCMVVFDNLINPYFNIMANYIEKELKSYGYDMMIYTADNVLLDASGIQKIISRQGDAVLTFLAPTREALELSRQNGVPMILLGRDTIGFTMDVILTDDCHGGYLAVERLIASGAKKLAYIGSKPAIECSDRRFLGASRCAAEHGLDCMRLDLTFGEAGATNKLDDLLSNKPDGLFVFNDQLAFAVIRHLNKKNIKIPEEIRIVGYDYLGREMEYPLELTTIATNKERVAKMAVEALMRKNEGASEQIHEIIDVSLVEGVTT